jgi:hypothetical protein
MQSQRATFRLILLVLAIVFFGLGWCLWPPVCEPYRLKLVSAGLFCWALSTLEW